MAFCSACDKVIRTRKKEVGTYEFTMKIVNEHTSRMIQEANVDEKKAAKLTKEKKELKDSKMDLFRKGRLKAARKSQVDPRRQFATKIN